MDKSETNNLSQTSGFWTVWLILGELNCSPQTAEITLIHTNLSHTSTKRNIMFNLFLPQTCLMLWDDEFGMLMSVSLKMVKKLTIINESILFLIQFNFTILNCQGIQNILWNSGSSSWQNMTGKQIQGKRSGLNKKWGIQKNRVWISRVQLHK